MFDPPLNPDFHPYWCFQVQFLIRTALHGWLVHYTLRLPCPIKEFLVHLDGTLKKLQEDRL